MSSLPTGLNPTLHGYCLDLQSDEELMHQLQKPEDLYEFARCALSENQTWRDSHKNLIEKVVTKLETVIGERQLSVDQVQTISSLSESILHNHTKIHLNVDGCTSTLEVNDLLLSSMKTNRFVHQIHGVWQVGGAFFHVLDAPIDFGGRPSQEIEDYVLLSTVLEASANQVIEEDVLKLLPKYVQHRIELAPEDKSRTPETILSMKFAITTQPLFRKHIDKINGRTLVVTGDVQPDGLGDYFSMRSACEILRSQFPGCTVVPIVTTNALDRVKKIADPANADRLVDVDHGEFSPELLEIFRGAACVVEMPTRVWPPKASQKEYAEVVQYLGDRHFFNGEYGQSMGVSLWSRGIFIKEFPGGSLDQLGDENLKNILFGTTTPSESLTQAYRDQHSLFFGYLKTSHLTQLGFIESAVVSQANDTKPIDIFIPVENTLEDLFKWEFLNKDFFVQQGVRQITLINKQGQPETYPIANEGKEVRLINPFPLSNADFKLVAGNSTILNGCTGDMSFSEMLMGPPTYYEVVNHKIGFFNDYIQLVKDVCGEGDYYAFCCALNEIQCNRGWERTAYTNSKYCGGEVDLSKLHPVERMFYRQFNEYKPVVKKRLNELREFNKQIGAILANSQTLKAEIEKVQEHLRQNYSFNEQFVDLVSSSIFIEDYPELKEFKKQLAEDFKNGLKTLPMVYTEMEQKIDQVLNQSSSSRPA